MKSQKPASLSIVATAAAAAALTSLYNRDGGQFLEQKFQYLTPPNLKELETAITKEQTNLILTASSQQHQQQQQQQQEEEDDDDDNDNDSTTFVSTFTSSILPVKLQLLLEKERNDILARAVIRRIVYKCLDKYNRIYSNEVIEDALRYHTLPETLQRDIVAKFGSSAGDDGEEEEGDGGKGGGPTTTTTTTTTTTWYECLERLQEINKGNKKKLWESILDHPMTSYVPVQCQNCCRGEYIVPDVPSTQQDDIDMGLSIIEEFDYDDDNKKNNKNNKNCNNSKDELMMGMRGGWFRGRPYPTKTVFVINCPKCNSISHWYRSGHPQIVLNPNNWGRLCGEQEELRLNLGSYLGIPLRLCIPLDWDHIWSEFYTTNNDDDDDENDETTTMWNVHDDSARNFAARLDEGIGTWTAVLAISIDPTLCCDVTDDYLSCRGNNNSNGGGGGGRADPIHSPKMIRYRKQVSDAKNDKDGSLTQARTLNGFVLQRAKLTSDDITKEMKIAAQDYLSLSKEWWE